MDGTRRARRIGLAIAALFLASGGLPTGQDPVRPDMEGARATAAAYPGVGASASAAARVPAVPAGPPLGMHPWPEVRDPHVVVQGTAAPASSATILTAGDIATCKHHFDEATARLLDRLPGTIVAVGDLAYPEGSAAAFRACYGPSWGRFLARTRAVLGNHDYGTGSAAPFLDLFQGDGPAPGRTWYAFDVGPWRAYALDSDCGEIGGCGPDSPEGRWLAADLAANPRTCSIAFMHHPRFSSGHHGNAPALTPLWRILYAAGVDIVISGHDHDYERFALLTPDGRRAPGRGIREFVVGTGGAPLRSFPRPAPSASQTRTSRAHGILRLDLGVRGYAWRFIAVAGSTFTDAGRATCH